MATRDTLALSSLTERVGDAERDALITELNGHHAHGRLFGEELDRRQGLALTAVTRYDLLVLVADLPGSDRSLHHEPDSVRRARRRELRRETVLTSTRGVVVAAPVVGTGWAVGLFTQYSSGVEVGFWATVVGGAVGYATHVVRTRLARPRAR